MSYECQIIGENNCGIGKECTNNNCDYRICDSCALNILKHSDHDNIFCKFNCPACQRPILFNFDRINYLRHYLFYIKKCINKFFVKNIFPPFFIFSIIWGCLCIGRVFLIILNNFGFMKGMSTDFFDQFLIKSIMGWVLLCILGILIYVLFLIIFLLFYFIITFCKKINFIKNKKKEFTEINQNP
tara:strand:- start:513 stop:1067 length:555 start_codon:yes stop_codon:yes gene_type:complete